jgi:hypothetical protein
MSNQKFLMWGGIVLGVFFICIAIMYWTVPPKSLPGPSFLGHESGVSAVHVKHGIASFLVGIACFVFAWFQSGPRKSATTSSQT